MAPNIPKIHIIEPTLSSAAGHCQSFVASLCGSAGAEKCGFTVWGGREAALPVCAGVDVSVQRFFYRKIRRVQEFFLLRRLLGRDERIFVSTAGRVDLMLLDLASSSRISKGRVFLFFHWVRPSADKLAYFSRMARKHPELVIMGPTRSVVDVFIGCGFKNCHVVPYPITPRTDLEVPEEGFRHILFAGAARSDKGFAHVVELVDLLARQGSSLPVSLQTSADHYDKYDTQTRDALERLSTIRYRELRLTQQTLTTEEYFEAFRGGICLQPYDPIAFADRISGITLDGLSMGAPVVTLAGTWMARVVERFDAGIVVQSSSPEALLGAVRTIVANYARYQGGARQAGATLQREHSAGHLLELLFA